MTQRFGLDNVSVRFPQPGKSNAEVIRGVSIDLSPSTITSIVGRSGCGKTTLLRVLAGLQNADAGEVRRPNEIGFVFQKPALLPWLTAKQNVRLPLEIGIGKNSSSAEQDGWIDSLLESVGLATASDLYPRQLSGGMQMRISLARALVTKPSLLLLDEPLSALDELLREELGELLLRLWDQQKFTAVMVTHNIAESIWLAHRVLIVDDGQVRESVDIDLPFPRNARDQSSERFRQYSNQISGVLRNLDSSIARPS